MSVSKIVNYALYSFVLLYALIYFIYIFFINAAHASISLMSISALLLPFILLLFFQWISWKYTDRHNKRKLKIRFYSHFKPWLCPSIFLCGAVGGV